MHKYYRDKVSNGFLFRLTRDESSRPSSSDVINGFRALPCGDLKLSCMNRSGQAPYH
eukprot:CAMPEP_0177684162 /NCGR_PEP_ID=MMETSP0447-20121125/32261_1 /TAXON_ID=0 /ORGANISM="Stygamoeba regulata, Strain BSH-02190019" /LENGTH=56 /DNA_ID=CAMNT_0019193945 /DNA_START=276 /DNA_END=443 /DNA_ORIENTATION=-